MKELADIPVGLVPPAAQMPAIEDEFKKALATLEATNRLRRCKTITGSNRPEIVLAGQSVIDFCSNDYLGLSRHPRLVEATIAATMQYGTGTGGARLIGGTTILHAQLEEAVAAFKQVPRALVFNSGYQANVGVLSALVSRGDTIFADRLNHASLVDGALLSRCKLVRYPHLDMAVLAERLAQAPGTGQRFIVTDTVFSMDGDLAPLADLFALAEQYNAWLILDEAHATGVFGEHHQSGLWETTGIGHHPNVIQIGTFSKALGSFGAYVAASKTVIETLIQSSRSFIYSTSLPPGVIAANLAAVDLVMTDPSHTRQLWDNVRVFQQYCQEKQIPLTSQSPIMPIILGDSQRALAVAEQLLAAGFYVQAIRPPTVPEGTARLRITLCANHTRQQLEQLANCLHPHLAESV